MPRSSIAWSHMTRMMIFERLMRIAVDVAAGPPPGARPGWYEAQSRLLREGLLELKIRGDQLRLDI